MATSDGRKEDPIPLRVGIFEGPTIWDRLGAAHVPARYYHNDLPIITLWGRRMDRWRSPIEDYFDDAAAGKLANFVMVDPAFRGDYRTDDHSWADIRYGQRFVREVFRAFAQSPQWERGLFVLIYDEWGGFFDHVRPPIVPDARRSADPQNDFGQTGFRVPAIVASPRARVGGVDHSRSDHTSVLRFLEWRFLGAPARGPGGGRWWLTTRDRHAHNLGTALGAGRPDPELAFEMMQRAEGTSASIDIGRGVNFYDEVRRFEIDLIRRALDQTGGHQSRAARLLGLNATTLNSKIKTYNIHTRL